jgi:tetratricopeptide (TPR) repeat protein
MGVFLWAGALFFELARRRIPRLAAEERTYAWASLAAVVGMMADNFFGNVSLFFAVPALLFFWLMGSLMRTVAQTEPRVHRARGPLFLGLCALGVVLAGAGIHRAYAHWRAEVLYFEGFKRAKQGDIQGAAQFTEKSHGYRRWEVNNNYEMANAYARQARWSMDKGLSQEAARLFQKTLWAYDEALAANAGYDEIYFNRGAVLTQSGRAEQAIASYRIALLINPLSLETHKALGQIYLTREKELPQAARHFETAVFYFPREKDFWNNLGYVYSRLGRKEEALQAYARAVGLDPLFEVAWKNFQSTLSDLGPRDHPFSAIPSLWAEVQKQIAQKKWPEARRAAESLVALLPDWTQAQVLLADIQVQTGDLSSAEKGYRRALEEEPGHWEARLHLGQTLAQAGRRTEALSLISALQQERPQDQQVSAILRSLQGAR